MGVVIHLLDEVQGSYAVRAVPQFNICDSSSILDIKLCCEINWNRFCGILNEQLTFTSTDEHCGDSQACTCSIVTHDHISDILGFVINNDSQAEASSLNVANLVDKGAISAPCNRYLAWESILSILVFII